MTLPLLPWAAAVALPIPPLAVAWRAGGGSAAGRAGGAVFLLAATPHQILFAAALFGLATRGPRWCVEAGPGLLLVGAATALLAAVAAVGWGIAGVRPGRRAVWCVLAAAACGGLVGTLCGMAVTGAVWANV